MIPPARCLWAVLLIIRGGHGASAEDAGSVGSRSAHQPGETEEALEHAHAPRHGGYFGDAEDLFHFEVLMPDDDRLVLYVNDELNRPLDVRELQGRWILNPDEAAPLTGDFTASPTGEFFETVLPPGQADLLHVKVEVLNGIEWVGMEFFLPGLR